VVHGRGQRVALENEGRGPTTYRRPQTFSWGEVFTSKYSPARVDRTAEILTLVAGVTRWRRCVGMPSDHH
jgi:hypothetical protein